MPASLPLLFVAPTFTSTQHPQSCYSHVHLARAQDTIFTEAYGGVRRPFSPVRFLDTWWRSAEGSLAGYQQQDAHEFYLSLLDGLGQTSDKYTPSASGSPSPAPSALADAGQNHCWHCSCTACEQRFCHEAFQGQVRISAGIAHS